ncbi:MAG TPA: protein translocase subunit SecD [Thalassobaculum sp.]
MLQFPTWKIVLVVSICLLGVVYAAPNAFERDAFGEVSAGLPGRQINLGLDLQGGSSLLLQVDTAVVVRERLDGIVEVARRELRDADIGYVGLGVRGDFATFEVREAADLDRARRLATEFEAGTEVSVDGNRVSIGLTEQAVTEITRNAVQQSIEIVRRRVDETGTREPLIQRQGDNRILIQLPGIDNPERVKSLIGQTAKLSFQLVDTSASAQDAQQGRVPPGSKLLPSADPQGPSHYVVKRRVMVSGENLVDSQPSFQDNRPVVSFRFDSLGGRRFGQATTENVGRPFAIILDDKVISAPVIREPILGGTGVISGNFSVQEAQDLALLLRAGALPAPLTVLEERSVGPGLGADSIAAGKIASIIGLVLVAVFMVVAYGLFGLFANLALAINIALILGALSAIQATLTLPGIAGIVLTMGMAVDANVLVFERIREEIDNGRSPINAVDAGYQRAWTTIVDSNLTTLFAVMFLYALGSGPVKGFAVTLGVGILTSMFTAVMVTRLVTVIWMRRRRPSVLPI